MQNFKEKESPINTSFCQVTRTVQQFEFNLNKDLNRVFVLVYFPLKDDQDLNEESFFGGKKVIVLSKLIKTKTHAY